MSIDFNIPVQMEPLLDLGEVTQPQLSDEQASKRAGKVAYGSGVPFNNAYSDIANGRESEIRQQLAAMQKSQRASDIVNFLSIRKDPLSAEEINAKFNAPIMPNSVVEDNYARRFINQYSMEPGHSVETNTNGDWQEMERINPAVTERADTIGSNLIAFREMTQTGIEDAESACYNILPRLNLSIVYEEVSLAQSLA